MKNEVNNRRFFNGMAFYAIAFLAVALTINFIARSLGSNGSDVFSKIAGVITTIAQCLAYVCACISAYGFVRSKRNIAYMIIYILACVLIAVFIILPLFGIGA